MQNILDSGQDLANHKLKTSPKTLLFLHLSLHLFEFGCRLQRKLPWLLDFLEIIFLFASLLILTWGIGVLLILILY